ncbi:MAG: hypothetical protein Q6M04_10375, partial [Thermostichus sp. BF3_bins_97]
MGEEQSSSSVTTLAGKKIGLGKQKLNGNPIQSGKQPSGKQKLRSPQRGTTTDWDVLSLTRFMGSGNGIPTEKAQVSSAKERNSTSGKNKLSYFLL